VTLGIVLASGQAATELKDPGGACLEIANKYIDTDIYDAEIDPIGETSGTLSAITNLDGGRDVFAPGSALTSSR